MVSRSPEEEKLLLIARVVIVSSTIIEYILRFGEMQMSSNVCTFLDTVALSFKTLIRSRFLRPESSKMSFVIQLSLSDIGKRSRIRRKRRDACQRMRFVINVAELSLRTASVKLAPSIAQIRRRTPLLPHSVLGTMRA